MGILKVGKIGGIPKLPGSHVELWYNDLSKIVLKTVLKGIPYGYNDSSSNNEERRLRLMDINEGMIKEFESDFDDLTGEVGAYEAFGMSMVEAVGEGFNDESLGALVKRLVAKLKEANDE